RGRRMSAPPPGTGHEPDAEERLAVEREAEVGGAVDVGASVGKRFAEALSATNVVTTLLAVLLALVIGAVILALSSEEVRVALGYFFARPSDTFAALGENVWDVYVALVRGAVGGANQL